MTPEERFEQNTKLVPFVFRKYFISNQNHKEDLISEGYLCLWKSCCNYDESIGSFCTYACSQIFFGMRNYLNRQIYPYNDISLDDIQVEDKEGNGICLYDMLCVYDENPTKDLVDACMQQMMPRDKSIIVYLLYGLTQQEIATLMKISQTTVSRCLSKFKTLIEKEKML